MSLSMENIDIIQANKNHISSLIKLRIALLRETGLINKKEDIPQLKEKIKEYFKENLNKGNFKSWIAKNNEEIVATSGLVFYNVPPHMENFEGKEAYIMNMFTKPEFRKRGIATKLLKLIINYAEKENINKIWLRSEKEAELVYKKVGFQKSRKYMQYRVSGE